MDQPYNSLAMITAFTRGQGLVGMDDGGVLSDQVADEDRAEYLLQRLATRSSISGDRQRDSSEDDPSKGARPAGLKDLFKGILTHHFINPREESEVTE